MRWILRMLAVACAVAIAAIALLWLIPPERVAAVASREFEMATGRRLSFNGNISPTLWPLGVRTGPVEISNAVWSAEGPMVTADGLAVGVRLWPLISGRVELSSMHVDTPRVILEREAGGRVNWSLEQSSDQGVIHIPHGTLTASNGTITYIDRRSATRRVAEKVGLSLSLQEGSGKASLDLHAMLAGAAMTVSATTADMPALTRGEVAPIIVSASAGEGEAHFEGRAAFAPFAAEGPLTLDLKDSRLLEVLSGSAPTAAMSAVVPLSLRGQTTWTAENSFHLREGRLSVGPTQLEGAVDLVLVNGRPRLEAELISPLVDLAPVPALMGLQPGRNASGWSQQAIDYAGLLPWDAELSLNAEGLRVGGVTAGPVQLLLTLDNGRGVAELREFKLHGGEVTGQIVMNGREGFSFGCDLRFSGVNAGDFLRELSGFQGITAEADGGLRVLGLGNSVAALMNTLSGTGSLHLSPGRVEGFDLARALQRDPVLSDGAVTEFDRVDGEITISHGLLQSSDLLLQSPSLIARGSGMVGIGPRTLNYRLEPEAMTSVAGGRLRVPVLISGTWSQPQVRLGVQSATDEAISEERRRLEEAQIEGRAPGGAGSAQAKEP